MPRGQRNNPSGSSRTPQGIAGKPLSDEAHEPVIPQIDVLEELDEGVVELRWLDPGDRVEAKVTIAPQLGAHKLNSWITYGMQTSVRPGESEEDTFARAAEVVINRVLDLGTATENTIDNMDGEDQ